MNKENIAIIKQKYPNWFEDHVSCNMFHDYITGQVNQYPVFVVKNYNILKPLGVSDVIQSDLSSYSEYFVDHMINNIESYRSNVCEKALI